MNWKKRYNEFQVGDKVYQFGNTYWKGYGTITEISGVCIFLTMHTGEWKGFSGGFKKEEIRRTK